MEHNKCIFFSHRIKHVVFIHAIFLFIFLRASISFAGWNIISENAEWPKRENFATVYMPDGSVIVLGGALSSSSGDSLNDVYRSANNGLSWRIMTTNAGWRKREGHSSISFSDGTILLMGGRYYDNLEYQVVNDIWKSTDNGAVWTKVTSSSDWPKRWMHTSVSLPDGSALLFGGQDDEGNVLGDVWRSTNKGTMWSELTDDADWPARWKHASVVLHDGTILIMGGEDEDGDLLNDVWRSTDKGFTWTRRTSRGSITNFLITFSPSAS